MAGQALAGLAVAGLSLVTIWLNPAQTGAAPMPADVRPAAFAYFTGSACVMALSLVGYLAFPWLPFAQQYTVPEGASPSCLALGLSTVEVRMFIACHQHHNA